MKPPPRMIRAAVAPVLLPPGYAVHAVSAMSGDMAYLFGCTAARCGFLGTVGDALRHVIAHQFTVGRAPI